MNIFTGGLGLLMIPFYRFMRFVSKSNKRTSKFKKIVRVTIIAVNMLIIVLFFLPWLKDGTVSYSGFDLTRKFSESQGYILLLISLIISILMVFRTSLSDKVAAIISFLDIFYAFYVVIVLTKSMPSLETGLSLVLTMLLPIIGMLLLLSLFPGSFKPVLEVKGKKSLAAYGLTDNAKKSLTIQNSLGILFLGSLFLYWVIGKASVYITIILLLVWIGTSIYYCFYKREIGITASFAMMKPGAKITLLGRKAVYMGIVQVIIVILLILVVCLPMLFF